MEKDFNTIVNDELENLSNWDFYYHYFPNAKISHFVIYKEGTSTSDEIFYEGFATCAHSDLQFESEKVGLRIARYRALKAAAMSEIADEKVREAAVDRIHQMEKFYIETQDKFNKRIKQLRKLEKKGIKPQSALPLLLD